jgi:hypothetical protein
MHLCPGTAMISGLHVTGKAWPAALYIQCLDMISSFENIQSLECYGNIQ